MANVILGALSWGLGHVTRDLPIIRHLLARGHRVTVATSGRALDLLRRDAPECTLVESPDYPAPYPKSRFFVTNFALHLPSMLKAISRERRHAFSLIGSGNYDLVISDNRFNFFHPDLPCFFISHQPRFAFPKPLGFMTPVSGLYNGRYHRHFLRLIVPDYADPAHNLTGILSHGFPVNRSRPYYAGVIASVRKLDIPEDLDLFISISGPEPQRTGFEAVIRAQLPSLPPQWRVVVTLGKPDGPSEPERLGNVTVHSFLGREAQQEMFNRARMIVARTGYTTVMELAELNRKALLVPTPGQTEQEYLGKLYRARGFYHCVSQYKLDLLRDLELARNFPGITWECSTARSVTRLYNDLFAPILDPKQERAGAKEPSARTNFLELLERTGHALDCLTVPQGFDLMLNFYRETRFPECAVDQDEDMLLYQWGTYGRDRDESFEWNITRQLGLGGAETGNIWQLLLTFHFAPTEKLRQLGRGDRWCAGPSDVDAFHAFIQSSPAFSAVAATKPDHVELLFEPTD